MAVCSNVGVIVGMDMVAGAVGEGEAVFVLAGAREGGAQLARRNMNTTRSSEVFFMYTSLELFVVLMIWQFCG